MAERLCRLHFTHENVYFPCMVNLVLFPCILFFCGERVCLPAQREAFEADLVTVDARIVALSAKVHNIPLILVSSSFFLLLSSLELSDTQVYGP